MKNKNTFKILFAVTLAVITALAFTACGDKSSDNGDGSKDKASKDGIETITYKTSDNTIDEDKYTVEITIEHKDDKVTSVTEVRTDDMSAADSDIATMMMNEYDGALDDSGLKKIDGVSCDVSRDGKVRTETKTINVKKADYSALKDSYIDWKTDTDYFSYKDFVKFLEKEGFTVVKQ